MIFAEINPVLLEWKEAFGIREFFHQQLICWRNDNITFKDLFLYAALKEFRFSGRPAWESSPGRKNSEMNEDLIHYTAIQLNMAQPLDQARLEKTLLNLKTFAREHEFKIIFFINPVDLKTLKNFAGDAVYESLTHRINSIREICKQHELTCLDLHNLISDSERFFDPHCVHLDEYARQQVANRLVEMFMRIMHES